MIDAAGVETATVNFMTWTLLVSVVVIAAACNMCWRVVPMREIAQDIGLRRRRLILRRGFLAMGLWQISVALLLVVTGATLVLPVALALIGVYFVWASHHLSVFGVGE